MTPSRKAIQVGIIFEGVQAYDIVCADLLGSISTSIIGGLASMMPTHFEPLLSSSPAVDFHWISSTLSSDRSAIEPMTMNMHTLASTTYTSCPRDLDILLIGGPSVLTRNADSLALMRELADTTTNPPRAANQAWGKMGARRFIMATCSGALWLADSGVLNGKKATVNRGALPMSKKMHPDVQWADQRWMVDDSMVDGEGKGVVLWTAGGANAGIDMMATFIGEMFDEKLVAAGCELLDVDPAARGQFYTKEPVVPWV